MKSFVPFDKANNKWTSTNSDRRVEYRTNICRLTSNSSSLSRSVLHHSVKYLFSTAELLVISFVVAYFCIKSAFTNSWMLIAASFFPRFQKRPILYPLRTRRKSWIATLLIPKLKVFSKEILSQNVWISGNTADGRRIFCHGERHFFALRD